MKKQFLQLKNIRQKGLFAIGFNLLFLLQIQPQSTISPTASRSAEIALFTPSLVDYDAFIKLVNEVDDHRKERLVTLEMFLKMSENKNIIILDTRSKAMYDAKHLKGAIHLNFSDFTQDNLAKIIPSTATKILIYCNNNFDHDQSYFPTKDYTPPSQAELLDAKSKRLTLALNIPSYINLYGYGYKNVYELSELISVFSQQVEFEGAAVNVVSK